MATVDITKIITGGLDRVKVYHKVVTAQPDSAVAFAATDIITYLSDLGEFGSSKNVTEISLYHLAQNAKIVGAASINDLQFTEVLTKDALTAMRASYDANDYLVTGIFDEEGNQLYGCFGQISSWGSTIPNGDTATLTYTMSLSLDNVTCTEPT